MTFIELKKTSIQKALQDNKTLLPVFSHLDNIIDSISNRGLLELYQEIKEFKKNGDKNGFLELFEENKSIMETIWSNPDFDNIIDAIFRASFKKDPAYSEMLLQQFIPFGKNNFEKHYEHDNTSINNFRDLRSLLSDSVHNFSDVNTDLDILRKLGFSDYFYDKKKESFFNVLYQPVDFDLRAGYIGVFSDNGFFYYPLSPSSFLDGKSGSLTNKYFNIHEDAYPEFFSDKYAEKLSKVHEYHKKHFDVTIPNFDISELLKKAIGSAAVSFNMTSNQNIPIELIISHEGQTHKLIIASQDAAFLLSIVSNLSQKGGLALKLNTTTKEIKVEANIVLYNLEGKEERPFVIINPYEISGSTILSYASFDSREGQMSGSIRERERASKTAFDFTALSEKPEEKQEIKIENPYLDFISKCNDYVNGYTIIEDGKRIPITDDYKKVNGEYLLTKKGDKVPDYDYVYSVREAFWLNNDFKIDELVGFFVGKGNKAKYRKLSLEILGHDCYAHEDELIDDLIKAGHLCVEELDIDYTSKKVTDIKYSYVSDYTKGDYYHKIEKLRGRTDSSGEKIGQSETQFSQNIKNYFGEFGNEIIERQSRLLDSQKNTPMSFVIESEKNILTQLEIGADNSLLWSESRLVDKTGWQYGTKSDNIRLPFVGKSIILKEFYKWINKPDVKNNASLLEFKNDVNELFDALVTPDANENYIAKYVLTQWLVKKPGEDEQTLEPIDLPSYSYKGSKGTNYRRIHFTVRDLMYWDGNHTYIKDMRPQTGAIETLTYRGNLTSHQYFKFNDTDEGIKARKAWEKTCDQLIKSAIDPMNKRKSKASRVCNVMFNLWLKTDAPVWMRKEIEDTWNRKYNSYIQSSFDKYPIFVRYAKYFGKKAARFTFNPTQKRGIKSYISRDNSQILGHDVGFGKTGSAIGAVSHMLETGEANRILLSVPNIVYDKWKKEILGTDNFKGLMPHANVVDLYNATDSALYKLKIFTDKEKEILATFKIFSKDYDIFLRKLSNKTLDLDKNKAEEILDILTNRVPTYALYSPLVELQQEIIYAFQSNKEQFESEAKKEKERLTEINNKRPIDRKLIQKKLDEDIAKKVKDIKKEYDINLTKTVTNFIQFRTYSLIDDLGYYKDEVLRQNTIILCTHEAMGRLRGNINAAIESYAIVDDSFDEITENYKDIKVSNSIERNDIINDFRNSTIGSRTLKRNSKLDLFKLPVSLEKLNVDSFIVDEIHDFNNIITTVRKRFIQAQESARSDDRLFKFGKAPIGASTSKNKAVIQYFTTAHGKKIIESFNSLCVARSIQNKNKQSGLPGNTLLLSATPFTDSPIFQMVSVFSIMNYELLLKCGISGTFDIFNQYAAEEWKLDLRHDKRIGIFPTVEKYKNIYANSNLLKLFVDFKISDPEIEAQRPKKYTFPDQHRAFADILGTADEINAYVPMNKYQEESKEKLAKYLHGEISYDDIFYKKKSDDYEEILNFDELIEVENEAEMLTLDVKNGQIVKLLDIDKYRELKGEDASNIANWSAPRNTEEEEFVLEGDEVDEEEVNINEKAGDIEETISKENFQKDDLKTAKTIVGMGADENISISPYIGSIKGIGLPELNAKNFVENSPKLLYIANCIKNVLDYHKEKNQRPSGQIVYLNRTTFKYNNGGGWVSYKPLEMFKEYLVSLGIPADEIAIIAGGSNRALKSEVANNFNEGKYKVLIGTSAIKQGVDLQVNTSVMYIAQADYVPSTIMQVEGRAWRQGNEWKNIRIVYVLSYGSLDAFQLSKVNQKIGQIKTMLEGSVFDLNSTQFTQDYNLMKLELETDLKKKAELLYEMEEEKINDELKYYSHKKSQLDKIKDKLSDYLPKWKSFIDKLNNLGQKFEQHAFEEAKIKFKEDVAIPELKEAQKQKLTGIVAQKEAELEKFNKELEEKLNTDIAAEEAKLENLGVDKKERKEIESNIKKLKEQSEKEPENEQLKADILSEEFKLSEFDKKSEAQKTEKETIEANIKKLKEEAKAKIITKGKLAEEIAALTKDVRSTFEKEREEIQVTDQQVMDYLQGRYEIKPVDDEESARKTWTDWSVTVRRQYVDKMPESKIMEVWHSMSEDERIAFCDLKGFKKDYVYKPYSELPGVIKQAIKDALVFREYDKLPDSVKSVAKGRDLFSGATTQAKPVKFIFIALTPESPYSQIDSVVSELTDYSRYRSFEGNVVITEETKKRIQPVIKAFEDEGYKKGTNLGEWYKETFGDTSNITKYQADSPREAFIFEANSFKFSAKKGEIIKNFYEQVGDETKLDAAIKENEDKVKELAVKKGNKSQIIKTNFDKMVIKDKEKRARGGYDINKQVEVFGSTNILLERRDD